MKHFYHVIILGGGASGMLCAIAAKKKNPALTVAVIEKNDRVGKKLLATGSGRCNLTNDRITADHYVGSFRDRSAAVLSQIDTTALLGYFRSLGLLCAPDGEGRYYPLSRQASSVLDVLRFNCEAAGVSFFCGETVGSVRRQGRFIVQTAQNTFEAEKLVIAAGSKAAPKLGSSGSAADLLRSLGHRVVPFAPALCPVRVQSPLLKPLKGLRAAAAVTLLRGGRTVAAARGEVQFNDDSLSGICVFDLSLYSREKDEIAVDLLPDISENELFNILKKNQKRFAAQPADCLMTGILLKRVALAVLKAAQLSDLTRPCGALSAKELRAVSAAAKALRFPVLGNAGFDRAQACTGGVHGSEIDPHTLRSKRCENLFVCGEAIDLCGACGGYNLHFAFASGIIAGEHL